MFGKLDVPTIREAKKRVRARNRFFVVLSVIFVLFLFYVLFWIIIFPGPKRLDFTKTLLWSGATFVLYIGAKALGRLFLNKMISAWESLDDFDPEEKVGGFKVGKIKGYTKKIADDMGIDGEPVKVCTMDSPMPNAFGLLWRNVICLDRSWLRILDEQELKALIAHELTHLKMKKTRPMFSHPTLFSFVIFLQISVLTSLFFFYEVSDYYFRFMTLFFIFHWVDMMFLLLPLKSSRAEEHLCDWSAVKYTDIFGAVNLMLKLGQRYEAINIINAAISEMKKKYRIPLSDYVQLPQMIDKNIKRSKIDPEGIRETVRETVEDMAAENGWKKATFSFSTGGGDSLFSGRNRHKVDWIQYDSHIMDFRLDEKELPQFIEDIKSDRKSFLFDAKIDSYKDSHGTHPTIKQRVLFLWKNYKNRAVS
ncbi:MAG: M56 family metallopeptidase [Thermoplasmata archaeon]